MNMKFEDWNKSLDYAEKVIAPYDYMRAFEYTTSYGEKGIVFQMIDNYGEVFAEYHTGIQNSFEEMKRVIDNCVNLLLEE